ncbi:hypothetical protein GA0061105_12243 [Rhizobium aethiopicum]|uniref:DUF2946 domain-containing protein n=1 Tax=Rhizobium aethiopicum TaxID=1138170 RepID=A0A1C3YB52_9HYPH|nr:hypothetical protein [Rhizobium aethiopicum]SCB61721.1 hypothetical protein GA0061105_12243 [Rhizobium aethiopicum]
MSGLLRLICAIALMMVGFAHKPPPPVALQVQLAAYVLPDGQFPTFCLNDNAAQPEKGTVHDYGCEACRLAGSIMVPEPPSVGAQAMVFATIARTIERQFQLQRAPYPPNSRPRAPPSPVIFA